MNHAGHSRTALARSSSFRRLWASQFATVTMVYGLSLAGIAHLEEQTGSSAGTGLLILSSILPAFLGSLVAGAVVDRFGRRPTLLVSHFSRALLGLGFWAGTGFLSPGMAVAAITLVNAGTATFGQFAFPAELSLVPDLVPSAQVPRANAFLQFGMLLGEGLGVILLTPALIRVSGVPAVGLSGALLCLAALVLVLGLPGEAKLASSSTGEAAPAHAAHRGRDLGAGGEPAFEGDGRKPRLTWADVKAGWKTIAADSVLRLVVLQATVGATLLLVLLSLLPGLATRRLGLTVADAPFLILPGGLAFVLAAAVVSRPSAKDSAAPTGSGRARSRSMPGGTGAGTFPHRPTPGTAGRSEGISARGRTRRPLASLSPPAWISAGLLVLGLSTVLLGLSALGEGAIGLALLAITGIGLGLGAVVIPGRVVLQQRPPHGLRARVIAGQLTLANAAAVIPLLIGGSVADRLGLGPVIIALGAIAVLAGMAGGGYLARRDRGGDLVHRGGDLVQTQPRAQCRGGDLSRGVRTPVEVEATSEEEAEDQ